MNDESLEEKIESPVLPEEEILPAEDTEEALNEVHHWIDDIFNPERERLSRQGIADAKSWVKAMSAVDKALTEYPRETLVFLAQAYGISFPDTREKEVPVIPPEIIRCLANLEQNQKNLWQALEAESSQNRQLAMSNFAGAKDDDGNLLHPHFPTVKNEMTALLSSGMAFDFESAYEKALWLNPQTRAELLEKQEAQNLQSLAEEADKAQTAGFSPKGGLEKEDFSQMTTREILEHTFKKLEG